MPAANQFGSPTDGPALIVGSAGQDGFYLGESLDRDGREIVRIGRDYLQRTDTSATDDFSVMSSKAVSTLVADIRPREIYYLAAHHRSSEDAPETIRESLDRSYATHVTGLANFLDAVSEKSPNSRLFYAASSHVFGNPEIAPQTEQTPFLPVNIYGITKVTGIQLCRLYRRQRGLYCCAGILYNHESPRRAATYVGRKIVKTAVAIKRGEADKLVLGNLDAEIDWGAAEDYVEAMRLILSQDDPDEFVIASGELHSIGEVVDVAFGALDLDPQKYLETNPDLITKSGQSRPLVGDASKLMQATGWTPKRGFEEIILSMVDAELGT